MREKKEECGMLKPKRSCQWPIGDPRSADFHFCGDQPMPGKPYCASHCSVAYVPIGKSGNDANA